jgi:hypothetical protein
LPFLARKAVAPILPYHYTFVIVAADLRPKELPPDLTLPELDAKLRARSKGPPDTVARS